MAKFGLRLVLFVALLVGLVVCPPPNRQTVEQQATNNKVEEEHKTQQEQAEDHDSQYKFAYSKYLELVVKILESEPKFQERIKGMNEEEIKSGKIADHIDDLGTEVFDQLTKAKIAEIDRLREEIQKQIEKDGDAKNIAMPEHLDVNDWEKFGKEDLRKLIKKTVMDMNAIDEKRKENFKKYELEKKAQEDHRLAQLSQEEREKAQREIEDAKQRHNQHEKLKHPGGREQLEEVGKRGIIWTNRISILKLSLQLEALFQVELEKVYNETNPDDDPKERIEEMYRMREHVVKQMDKNEDRMISLEEFLHDNQAQEDNKPDEGWDDLANQKVYTDEELKKFEEEYAKQQDTHQAGDTQQPQQQAHQVPPVQHQCQCTTKLHLCQSNNKLATTYPTSSSWKVAQS
uniref:EF-hand domain-containing protein n=1 Tax=Ditylenchus dipsaci TaxID=166011 RepID=A0A915DMD9_9BILA